MTVFNLNLLARTCRRSYGRYKARLVGSMRQEQEEIWKQRGEGFDAFRPVQQRREPTEWFILLYVLWRAFVRPWMSTRSANNGSSIASEDPAESQGNLLSETQKRIFPFRKRLSRQTSGESWIGAG